MLAKNLRTMLIVAVVLLGTTLAMPPAAATHPVFKSSSASGTCAPTPVCSITVTHSVSSSPSSGHCTGSAGSYTSCRVTHSCSASVSGTLTTGTLSCSHVGGATCTTGTGSSCVASTSGVAVVAVNTCVTFTATGTATHTTLSSVTRSPAGLTVCVDPFGPS